MSNQHIHEEPLDEEERQLAKELEAGEWVSDPNSVITGSAVETVSALEAAADELERAQGDPYRWKWVILTLHSAVQGMMALALKGSNGLNVLKSDDAKRLTLAIENGTPIPTDLKMDSFPNLYKKIKSDSYIDSEKFTPQGTQGRSIKLLNQLRNQFIHFTPCTFILVRNGLPKMTLDCLNIARFLADGLKNIAWPEDLGGRTERAFTAADKAAQEMEQGSDPTFVVTDEFVETISALEATADELQRVQADPYRWKWVILALHSAVQGMMTLALRGTNNLKVLKPEDKKRFLEAVESDAPLPADMKIDDFLSLYRKIKSEDMLFYVNSEKFTPQGTEGQSLKALNRLRDQYVHFIPCAFILRVNGLPEMTIDCLNIVWFLAWNSNNVGWDVKDNGTELKERAKKAFRTAAKAALEIKEAYALPPS